MLERERRLGFAVTVTEGCATVTWPRSVGAFSGSIYYGTRASIDSGAR